MSRFTPTAALTVALAFTPAIGVGAEPASAQGDSWNSIAKLPDWSGVWEMDFSSFMKDPKPPLNTAAEARNKAYLAGQAKGENLQSLTANCIPPALPWSMWQPYPIEFLFTPGKVTVAIEAYSQMRRIFTDGRALPEDPVETFQGHSVGHWEGDTLVVDSIAIANNYDYAPGTGHGPQMHVVERMRLTGPDRLEIQTTITDPQVLTAPFVVTRPYSRNRDWDILEYVCQQGNRDSADEKGRPGLRLN